MSLYGRKLWRELARQKGQSLAVMLVTALGVLLFVTSGGAYRDLRDSYAATRERLALAGLQIDLAEVSAAGVEHVASLPMVAHAETRLQTEVPVSVGRARATLRVLSLPDDGSPRLDRLLLIEGKLPGDTEIVLEKHFARFHHLGPGSSLSLGGEGGLLHVSGVAVSPEYLWVARNANDFMPSAAQFGVGWVRRSWLRVVAARLIEQAGVTVATPSLTLAAGPAPGNQILVELKPDSDAAQAARAVEAALTGAPGLHVTASGDQVGVKLMQMDLDGYKGMAALFPLFFLGIGAFIVGSALARLIDAQRSTIGTLTALGVGPITVLGHYLAYAVVLGGVGSLVGAVAGQAAAPALTHEYADELGIPFVTWHLHADLLLAGVAIGVSVAAVAGLLPALRAMRLRPAEAMRPPRPHLGVLARLARQLPLPLPLRLAVRDVLGRPLRSMGTAVGVSAALVLVLATGVLLDAMKTTLSVLFDQAQTYDVRVDFASPTGAEQALTTVRARAGVLRAEALVVLPARLEANGHTLDALLQAPGAEMTLVRSLDVDGRLVSPAPHGLTLTREGAKRLSLRLGDPVKVTPAIGGPAVTLSLSGFADAAMGTTATVQRGDVDGPWNLHGLATSVVASVAPGEAPAVRDSLADAYPQALRVEDAAATRAQLDVFMGLGWVMLLTMLAFAAVLAAAILYNTATLTVLERQRDLATLRALGHTMREIALLLTSEHALLTVAGLALGLPLSVVAARALLRSFESELFSLPFVLAPATVTVAVIGVMTVVLLAQWPALRRLSRASLAEAVRSREG